MDDDVAHRVRLGDNAAPSADVTAAWVRAAKVVAHGPCPTMMDEDTEPAPERSSEYRPRADLTDRHRNDVADVDRVQEEPAGLRQDGGRVEEPELDVVALGFRPADHAGGDVDGLELKALRRRLLEDFPGLEEVGPGVVDRPVFRLDAEVLELVVNAVEEILETVARSPKISSD